MNATERDHDSAATAGIPDPPLPFTGGRIPIDEAERRLVERRVMLQCFVAPGSSLAVLSGGFSLGWPRLAALGVAGLGVSGLLMAWFALSERRLMFIRGGSMTPRTWRYFIYEGTAAIPFGLVFAIAGAAALAAGLLYLGGMSTTAMRTAVLARPHRALLPLGAALACQGLGLLIGFSRAATSWRDRLVVAWLHLPARLGGIILLALGGSALAAGILEGLLPAAFRAAFAAYFGNPWPFQ
ncbi:MAG: hypothetical protein IT480_02540 [Gammaproteobacteria bacterium]|nr:hypothetical protein [Gammaproteobacteria bacterium]